MLIDLQNIEENQNKILFSVWFQYFEEFIRAEVKKTNQTVKNLSFIYLFDDLYETSDHYLNVLLLNFTSSIWK